MQRERMQGRDLLRASERRPTHGAGSAKLRGARSWFRVTCKARGGPIIEREFESAGGPASLGIAFGGARQERGGDRRRIGLGRVSPRTGVRVGRGKRRRGYRDALRRRIRALRWIRGGPSARARRGRGTRRISACSPCPSKDADTSAEGDGFVGGCDEGGEALDGGCFQAADGLKGGVRGIRRERIGGDGRCGAHTGERMAHRWPGKFQASNSIKNVLQNRAST